MLVQTKIGVIIGAKVLVSSLWFVNIDAII